MSGRSERKMVSKLRSAQGMTTATLYSPRFACSSAERKISSVDPSYVWLTPTTNFESSSFCGRVEVGVDKSRCCFNACLCHTHFLSGVNLAIELILILHELEDDLVPLVVIQLLFTELDVLVLGDGVGLICVPNGKLWSGG